MAANILFKISKRHFLSADINQWTILRQDKHNMVAIAFIGSTKTNLFRFLAEHEIPISMEARKRLAAMPEKFLEWRDSEYQEKRGDDEGEDHE